MYIHWCTFCFCRLYSFSVTKLLYNCSFPFWFFINAEKRDRLTYTERIHGKSTNSHRLIRENFVAMILRLVATYGTS
ncbi:hypothetical protein HanRHA438_Chr09g0415901 [Helianthus annuus]|nr:hypothetical protein HanIR_Chr09g0435401 [Helianthus annuus]KAJ0889719.1 hypothetical protein HanRHA438_Chr09g0415901 [Helianthus annuus]